MKLMIAIPTPGQISTELAAFLINGIGQAFEQGHAISLTFEQRDDLCRARNHIVKTFLQSDSAALQGCRGKAAALNNLPASTPAKWLSWWWSRRNTN